MISDSSFLSLRATCPPLAFAEALAQAGTAMAGGSVAISIAPPRLLRRYAPRNDTEGYYPMLQTYKVSPIYLNWLTIIQDSYPSSANLYLVVGYNAARR
jgi:hypothetical protein